MISETAEDINYIYNQTMIGYSCMSGKPVGEFYFLHNIECHAINNSRALVCSINKTFYMCYGENHYILEALLEVQGYKKDDEWIKRNYSKIQEIKNAGTLKNYHYTIDSISFISEDSDSVSFLHEDSDYFWNCDESGVVVSIENIINDTLILYRLKNSTNSIQGNKRLGSIDQPSNNLKKKISKFITLLGDKILNKGRVVMTFKLEYITAKNAILQFAPFLTEKDICIQKCDNSKNNYGRIIVYSNKLKEDGIVGEYTIIPDEYRDIFHYFE